MNAPYREEFPTFESFVSAVVRADADGLGNADPRLLWQAPSGLSAGVPAEGGFAIPEEFSSQLWEAVTDTGQILARCTRQPVTNSNGIKIPAVDERSRADGSRFGGLEVHWAADEAEAVTAEKAKFRRIHLLPKRLLGLAYATDELLADAPALVAWLRRAFAEEASFTVENTIINGSGAGRPLGVLNANALITVSKESGQSADTIVAANFTSMFDRLWAPSRSRAAWLIQPDVWAQIAPLHLAEGQPLLVYSDDGTPQIFGRPVLQLEQCPALGDKGDVILADMSQYLIGEERPDFISSLHVRFLAHEGVFRFRWRIDGQPAWHSAVTPLNSSTTQSPFITLEARE